MAGEQAAAPEEHTGVERLRVAVEQALKEAPVEAVISELASHFVGMMVEVVRRRGHDVSLPIHIDGGSQRDVTIHPPKGDGQGMRRH